jgi:flagellar basal-body rod modification protein FlgD
MTTTIAGTTAAGSSSNSAAAKANQQAFGSADFLSIMLSEITNQDPLNPSDTSKMVESMRQLQVLANTASEKFRADVTWAQQMTGTMVNVTQVVATPEQQEDMKDVGLNPDVGYGNKDIRIDGFRVIDQTVWVQAQDGKQYPIDNIKQVLNNRFDTDALSEISNRMLGMRVGYLSGIDGATRKEGVVTGVGYDSDGKINLAVDGGYIRYDDVIAISVPGK